MPARRVIVAVPLVQGTLTSSWSSRPRNPPPGDPHVCHDRNPCRHNGYALAHVHPLRWLGQRDRGFAALRRATRTAIIMPAMFALGDKVLGNPQLALFAAFGSFAMLLLVDFGGPMAELLQAQADRRRCHRRRCEPGRGIAPAR